jgi:hypothetical protein
MADMLGEPAQDPAKGLPPAPRRLTFLIPNRT